MPRPAQAVFDLPRKLRAALERGAYEVAADAVADAAPLLKKYGHKARAYGLRQDPGWLWAGWAQAG